jgi:phage tail sheath protein FI
MATYKTPDVYVEEISIFPPSVAEVETAIPAFIGYTEKADKLGTNDLNALPTRISSLLEYEMYFGYGPPLKVTGVIIDENNNFKSAAVSTEYYMYDAVRMFYSNGGGDCYIVSTELYGATPDYTQMKKALDAVELFDEPTMLLLVDGVSLSGNGLYDIQRDALLQCKKLMDRVAIFDLHHIKSTPSAIADFRNNIGINYLKYGMAYTPWLNVSLSKDARYSDIKGKVTKSGGTITLSTYTDNAEVKTVFEDYDKLLADKDTVTANATTLFGANTAFVTKFEKLVSNFEDDKDVAKLQPIMKLLFDLGDKIDNWGTGFTNTNLKTLVGTYIAGDLSAAYTTLTGYDKEADADITGYGSQYTAANYTSTDWTTNWATPTSSAILNGTDDTVKMNVLVAAVKVVFSQLNDVLADITAAVKSQAADYESSLKSNFPLYKNIITGVQDSSTVMPPGGAMAGVFASVDRDRGVWKAPANVSLNSVIGPATTFTASQLDDLNIDVIAGKSINAIRAFTGKGTLVWGARTLAGNDNEWRYIPVRRFFNMVEESIKKATYWAVFEPNSSNTWVKVKGMIDNYLTNKWKDGALVGAKPDEAFFVKIGLGSTMTAQDILNGYMNVEIGMAVARPAEFIVLKFSHKLQQS